MDMYVLAIVNSAVMNIEVHLFLSVLVSSVCMPSSGTAGSYGSSSSSQTTVLQFSFGLPTDSVESFQREREGYKS